MSDQVDIKDLTVTFLDENHKLTVIKDLSLSVKNGETLAIIGESGSGKSVLGLAILRLLSESALVSGSIYFQNLDLLTIDEKLMQKIRGRKIAYIPQNPKLAFNPSMKMWVQLSEPMVIHTGSSWSEAKKTALKLLKQYGIFPSEKWAEEYPTAYSGGMLQRAMMAMGTSTLPLVLIADEPTKGIDSLKRKDLADIFKTQKELKITQIIITHDLEFAKEIADRVAVMYCGQIVELCTAERFFTDPRHPYSKGLINALPKRGLCPIPGSAPSMYERHTGCQFKSRCSLGNHLCSEEIPLTVVEGDNVRCTLYYNWKFSS